MNVLQKPCDPIHVVRDSTLTGSQESGCFSHCSFTVVQWMSPHSGRPHICRHKEWRHLHLVSSWPVFMLLWPAVEFIWLILRAPAYIYLIQLHLNCEFAIMLKELVL